MTGRTLMVDIDGNQTVNDLKQKIKEQEGIAMVHQRLILSGKSLENRRKIRDCHTSAQNAIILVVRYSHG